MAGSRVSTVAVPWLVLTTTGSATRVGVVAFAQLLPLVLAGLIGGPLVDRAGPRRIAIAADSVSVLAVGSVPLLHALGHLSFGVLVLAMIVAGSAAGLGDTAKHALAPQVIADSGVSTTRGATLFDGIGRTAMLVGLPLGGVLIAVFGPAGVLAVDAASFAFCAVVVATTVRPLRRRDAAPESYLAALRTGFGYFRRDSLISAIVGLLFFTNLVDQAYIAVLVPVWVRDTGAATSTLGLIGGAFGLGAVLGNLTYLTLADRLPRRATFAICFLLGGPVRLFALAVTDDLTAVLMVVLVSGFLAAAINPILSAVGYERIPPDLRGRVLGAITACSWAGVPVGALLGGLTVESLGLHPALLIGGGIYVLVTLTPFILPTWRQLNPAAA
ncbi:putative multidrug-efflux transporter [Winogradskya humida]|uniref:Multidrug-efflux transporter n=2 Tax=Winogradskya humida TaxID=113566 RepID=A0ABQ3ZQN2_9ACTN|nr:putative multidrug-efflux transporter [Actinoplanes humidus]